MKTIHRIQILLAAIPLLSTFNAQSQWINSITHVPANPTPSDTIYFYADLSFPSGNCDEHSDIYISSLPSMGVFTLHCLGMLSFICSHTDTFKFDPLPAGNYTFFLHVDAGSLPAPCTPGINPGPTDSIQFTVGTASAISIIENKKHDLIIFPNPARDKIKLQVSDELSEVKNKLLVVYSVDGKENGRWKIEDGKLREEIDISPLSNGIYFCGIIAENQVSDKIKLIVIKQDNPLRKNSQ